MFCLAEDRSKHLIMIFLGFSILGNNTWTPVKGHDKDIIPTLYFPPLNFFLHNWFYKPSNIPFCLFIHWGLLSNRVLHATMLNLYPKLWWVVFFCLLAFLHNSYIQPQTRVSLSPSGNSGCRSDSRSPVSSSEEILWLLWHLEQNTIRKEIKNSSSVQWLHFFHSIRLAEDWKLRTVNIRDMKSWSI